MYLFLISCFLLVIQVIWSQKPMYVKSTQQLYFQGLSIHKSYQYLKSLILIQIFYPIILGLLLYVIAFNIVLPSWFVVDIIFNKNVALLLFILILCMYPIIHTFLRSSMKLISLNQKLWIRLLFKNQFAIIKIYRGWIIGFDGDCKTQGACRVYGKLVNFIILNTIANNSRFDSAAPVAA